VAQSRNQSVLPFTPKAFANFSPGLERSDNPGITALLGINAESVGQLANSFGVDEDLLKKTRTYELATQRAHQTLHREAVQQETF
jgi:hypothetical protein